MSNESRSVIIQQLTPVPLWFLPSVLSYIDFASTADASFLKNTQIVVQALQESGISATYSSPPCPVLLGMCSPLVLKASLSQVLFYGFMASQRDMNPYVRSYWHETTSQWGAKTNPRICLRLEGSPYIRGVKYRQAKLWDWNGSELTRWIWRSSDERDKVRLSMRYQGKHLCGIWGGEALATCGMAYVFFYGWDRFRA